MENFFYEYFERGQIVGARSAGASETKTATFLGFS
jgi:hypothetical protein